MPEKKYTFSLLYDTLVLLCLKRNHSQKVVSTINYITLDLEWNQAERWRTNRNIPFEIIEIGAVKLDQNWNMIDRFSMLVRPNIYPHLFNKVTEIVNITEKELMQKGKPFPKVIKQFWDWCGEDFILCTWGSMDITELLRNISYYRLKNPLQHPVYYCDIQKIYSIQYDDGKSRSSLEMISDQMQIEGDLQFHRAFSDAYYTAQIMKHLDRKLVDTYLSLDYFHIPADSSEEVYMTFDDYSKYVSRPFHNKNEAFADSKVSSCVCYLCGTNVKKSIPWFSYYGRCYYSAGICPNHGWIRSKIRLKKAGSSQQVYVIKTTKIVTESDIHTIEAKREEVREKRKKHGEGESSAAVEGD